MMLAGQLLSTRYWVGLVLAPLSLSACPSKSPQNPEMLRIETLELHIYNMMVTRLADRIKLVLFYYVDNVLISVEWIGKNALHRKE